MRFKSSHMVVAIIIINLFVIGLVAFFVNDGDDSEEFIEDAKTSEPDYLTAIEIAEEFLESIDRDPNYYQVIKVENLVSYKGMYQGPDVWHITFKRADLIPKSEFEEVGAGGEIFISVNVKERSARLLGYGE